MNFCYEIAVRRYRRRMSRQKEAGASPVRSEADYWNWQFETSRDYFGKYWDLLEKVPGARILDIGCGIGGRACFLAGLGARSVVGVDINADEITKANGLVARLRNPSVQSRVNFMKVRENEPLDLEPFDVVTLVASMEHVRDPVGMLDLAHSMLRPGGVCYFGTSGWYHYGAAHVAGELPIPFLTVFFSDRTILDAIRRIVSLPDYEPTRWDSVPPVARWANVHDLRDRPGEYLNKVTIRGLRRAMKQSRFGEGKLRVQGFSWRQRPWMRWLNVLARIPGIQEVYHGGVFGRLERRE